MANATIRDGGGHPLCGTGGRCSDRENDVDVGQLGRQTRKASECPVRRAILDQNLLALHIAAFA
jgi:hypothetical protein